MRTTKRAGPPAPAIKEQECPANLAVDLPPGVTEGEMWATLAASSTLRHSQVQRVIAGRFAQGVVVSANDALQALSKLTDRIVAKDSAPLVSLLYAQAVSLDVVVTDLLARSDDAGDLQRKEVLMRLALKAQANSRATVEALAKIVGGGVQTVIHKHVHVGAGGQAVVAETVNNHPGGGGVSVGNEEQGHGAGPAAASPALPSPDPARDGMSLAGHAERPLSDTRREEPRRSKGK